MANATKEITCFRHSSSGWREEPGAVIVEIPVSLSVNGEEWLSFMCTPIDLEAMAVGFLYNEGLIETKEEIADVQVCMTGDHVDVWLNHSVKKPAQWWRTSGCTGGMTSIEKARDQQTTSQESIHKSSTSSEANVQGIFDRDQTLTPEQISLLSDKILEAQSLYRITGGVHSTALSDGQRLLIITEDIGRHNTLDKIAGRCLLEDIEATPRILITTGRISSEMLQKASRIGAIVVISRTAPSNLAIELADQAGITLIGYARRDRFIVYAHPRRLMVH